MPLYEYECANCKRRTEKIQKFSDPPLTVCPHCGGPLEQTIHAPAVAFKGGGWYADLYSSSKGKNPGAGEGKGESKPESSGSSSSSGDSTSTASSKDTSSSPTPASTTTPASPSSSGSSEKK